MKSARSVLAGNSLAAALLAVLLVGCSAAPSAPAAPTASSAGAAAPKTAPAPTAPPAAPAPTAPPAAAVKPAETAAASKPVAQAPAAPAGVKQELVIAQGTDPQNLDPHVINQQPTRNITQAVAEPLVDWDFNKSALVPVLATEWKLLDQTTWQFKLRPNVKFSNGEPWNANVAKFNFERVRQPDVKSGFLLFVDDIARVEVVDPMTLNLVTKTPSPSLPINISRISMVAQQYATEKGLPTMAKSPVGTGPYRVSEYVQDERVVLEPNPTYWGSKPTLTKITFRPVPDPASRVAALKTGRADVITLVPIPDVEGIKADQHLDVLAQPGQRSIFVQINTMKYEGPLKDQKVRQALNYAVDKDALIKSVLTGFGAKLNGTFVTPSYFGYNPNLQPYPYDPAKARQLLTEAGYPDGFETSLTTPQGRYMADKELAEAVAGQLVKVGVRVSVKVKDWGVITQEVGDHTLGPLAFYGLSSVPDATTLLAYQLTGSRNSQRSVPAFDAVIKEARQTMDDAKRIQLLHKAAEVLRDDAYIIFLTQQFDLYGYNTKVQNLKPFPNEQIVLTGIVVR
ncbi:MAG: hypothetical protein IT307_02795 [Chloroflexi bacterium]|nr:hypothetical protein [Chloroflexota bacterium]